MDMSPQKRSREVENDTNDQPALTRRRISFLSPEMTKSQRVQILAIKNRTMSKLTSGACSPDQFMPKISILPTVKMPKFATTENVGSANQDMIWGMLRRTKGAPKDERALCIALLREVAGLNRVVSTPRKEGEMGNNQQAIRSSSWPGCLQSGQIPLVSNVLKLLKSEFNISTPMLGIEVIEQVCRDRQNRLRRSKQGMLRCRKCKEAGKVRAWCKVCWGSQICRHGRQKRQCKDCGGSGLCVHGRRRSRCKDCGGSGLCKHKRRKGRCKLCGGNQICQHGRRRTHCKLCGGNGLCSHGRQKSRCKECVTGSPRKTGVFCNHVTPQTDCKHCLAKCPACKAKLIKGKCQNCRATKTCKHGIVTMLCEKCMGAPHCTHELPCTCCAKCAANADTPNGISWVWGGASVGRVRGIPTICGHGRLKSYCRDCGGSPICKHGRDERYCRECGGSGLCRHGKVPAYCKECHGDTLCVHGFKRHRCKTCCVKTKRQICTTARPNKTPHPSIFFNLPKSMAPTNEMMTLLPDMLGTTNKMRALLSKPVVSTNQMSVLLPKPLSSTNEMMALLPKQLESTNEMSALLSKPVGSNAMTALLPTPVGSNAMSALLPKPLESTNEMNALLPKPLESTNEMNALLPKPLESTNDMNASLSKPVESTDAVNALLLLSSTDSSKAATPGELSSREPKPQTLAKTATATQCITPAGVAMSSNPSLPLVKGPIYPLSSDPSHPLTGERRHPLANAASRRFNQSEVHRNSRALVSQLARVPKRQHPTLSQVPELRGWSQSKVPLWCTPPRLSVITPDASPLANSAQVPTFEPSTLSYAANPVSSYDRALFGGGASVDNHPTSIPVARRPQLSSMLAESARAGLKIRMRPGQLLQSTMENSRPYAATPVQSLRTGSLPLTAGSFDPTPESLRAHIRLPTFHHPDLSAPLTAASLGCFLRV